MKIYTLVAITTLLISTSLHAQEGEPKARRRESGRAGARVMMIVVSPLWQGFPFTRLIDSYHDVHGGKSGSGRYHTAEL